MNTDVIICMLQGICAVFLNIIALKMHLGSYYSTLRNSVTNKWDAKQSQGRLLVTLSHLELL